MKIVRTLMRGLLAITALLPLHALAGGGGAPQVPSCPVVTYPDVDEQSLPAPLLKVDGREIKDQNGRTVLLRGINTSGDSKVPGFQPITSAAQLDILPKIGVNTLRLLFTWEALESTRCEYDEGYLAYFDRVVQWAADRDLYVIVDFHQDAFSRYSIGGCGEGFPEWAIHSSIKRAEPKNDETCENWGIRMVFDPSHHKSWQYFHSDSEGARTRYLDMVKAVAERMAKHPNVIGYDVINEPWGTDAELDRLYNDVGNAIRSRDPNRILFVPPNALLSSGIPNNNIPKPKFDNLVYSPHYYDPGVITLSNWIGISPAIALNRMASTAHAWNVPLLLGEYGAPADTKNITGYMDALNQWLNDGFHHGTQWNYTPTWRSDIKDGWNNEDLSITDDQGNLRAAFVPRVYPIATAGKPVLFEESQTAATYIWYHQPTQGNTELFVPQGYMNGKKLSVDNANCTLNGLILSCHSTQAGRVILQIK